MDDSILDVNHHIVLTDGVEFYYYSTKDNVRTNIASQMFMKKNGNSVFGMVAYGNDADALLKSILTLINFNKVELERRGVKDEIMAFRIDTMSR